MFFPDDWLTPSHSGPEVRLWEVSSVGNEKRAAGQEIEDRTMLSPRRLEAAFHGEKQTQTNPEDRPEAAGS
jgi:hypothetical protein